MSLNPDCGASGSFVTHSHNDGGRDPDSHLMMDGSFQEAARGAGEAHGAGTRGAGLPVCEGAVGGMICAEASLLPSFFKIVNNSSGPLETVFSGHPGIKKQTTVSHLSTRDNPRSYVAWRLPLSC